jgi:hypothetical protein
VRFTFLVEVEVERDEGKFASRDELAEQIVGELEGADPGSLEGDEGGSYSVASFDVEEFTVERNRTLMDVTTAERKTIEQARAARRKG